MLERIGKLIRQFEEEKASKNSSYLSSHIDKTILLLQSMSKNISNPSSFVDITKDIETIIYWSVDSWSWENQLTKDTCKIIELYEKLVKHKKK